MKYVLEIPESLKLELDEISKEEKFVKESDSAAKVMMIGLEKWKQDKSIELLRSGELTMLKAAKMAGMNVWDFILLLQKEDIAWIKMRPEEIKKEIQEALS